MSFSGYTRHSAAFRVDAQGYAKYPDCGGASKLQLEVAYHDIAAQLGLANLEKRHQGTKICIESKTK